MTLEEKLQSLDKMFPKSVSTTSPSPRELNDTRQLLITMNTKHFYPVKESRRDKRKRLRK